MISGEARYTLSEDRLLREKVDYKVMVSDRLCYYIKNKAGYMAIKSRTVGQEQ